MITIRGIRTTAPPRTALDLATLLTPAALAVLVTRMLHKRLLLPSTFGTLSTDHRGHPGLARLLAPAPQRAPTESPLEDRVRELILDPLDLPEPMPP